MRRKKIFYRLILFFLLIQNICFSLEKYDQLISKKNIEPKGVYYDAVVPDTLDLAQRAGLAVIGLNDFLNPKQNYTPFGQAYFNTQKAYMTQINGDAGQPNWGKIAEAVILTRLMSGSKDRLDIEEKMLNGMLDHIKSDGSTPAARVMMALMSLYQQNQDPRLKQLISEYAQSFVKPVTIEGDYAYYYKNIDQPNDTKIGIIGQGTQLFVNGTALRGLSRWTYISKDGSYIDFCAKLKNWALKPQFWIPEAAPKAVVPDEHGEFSGHHHSYTAGLMGLLWYADVTNDQKLKEFVRDSYEYLRTFGISAVGLYGESCTIGDMTFLAAKLSNMGVGDYWDDVDHYVRNHMAEVQITDTEKLEKAVNAQPIYAKRNEKKYGDSQKLLKNVDKDLDLVDVEESDDNVCKRNLGCFLSDAGWPTYIPKHRFLWTICCSGNTTFGMFCAWDSIVQFNNGHAQINLLLNRASTWLDLDSYLPFEGKIVIKNRSANSISVRIPAWVKQNDLKASLNDSKADFFWAGRYIVFDKLKNTDVIKITFPLQTWRETYTLKWKNTDFWMECTDPGGKWQPEPNPQKFTFTFKANTVISVSPDYQGTEYKLYDRKFYESNKAPMKKVTRFVSPVTINW